MMEQNVDHWPAKTGDDNGQSLVKSDAAHISLCNFTFVKVLGKGSFGKVYVKAIILLIIEQNLTQHFVEVRTEIVLQCLHLCCFSAKKIENCTIVFVTVLNVVWKTLLLLLLMMLGTVSGRQGDWRNICSESVEEG